MYRIQVKIVLYLLIFLVSEQISGQDLLYKKDSKVLKVKMINIDEEIISYQIEGDSSGTAFYLGKSLVDSIKYSDGKIVEMSGTDKILKLPLKITPRNNFSTEFYNLFTGKVNLEYERISKTGRTGFVTGVLINFNTFDNNYWEKYRYAFEYPNYSPHYYFIRLGINFYPFVHSLVRTSSTRFSTGFSLFLGSYRKMEYDYYNYTTQIKHVAAGSFMWNMRLKIFIANNFQLTCGTEMSLIPFMTFFCPQIGCSIGF